MKGYFWIRSDADGAYINYYKSKEDLLEEFQDNEADWLDEYLDDFNEDIPDSDFNYWDKSNLIIKGEIIVPKEKKVVTEIDI